MGYIFGNDLIKFTLLNHIIIVILLHNTNASTVKAWCFTFPAYT